MLAYLVHVPIRNTDQLLQLIGGLKNLDIPEYQAKMLAAGTSEKLRYRTFVKQAKICHCVWFIASRLKN